MFRARKLYWRKIFRIFFGENFLHLSPRLQKKINNTLPRLGDIGVRKKTENVTKFAKKIPTQNHRYWNNRRLRRYLRFAPSARSLKNTKTE